MIKRTFDIVTSIAGLVVTAPLLICLMVWIRLETPGPAIFTQRRVGLGGRIFAIYKLRTMVANAAQIGGYSTASGDPRITRTGHFLRRASLDELPQLVNVLLGDMSLVGPRPDTPMQESNYSPADWQRRNSVRPGITGLAQARLRSAATAEQRLSLDLEYTRRATFAHDLAILWETASALLTRKVN